MACDVVQMGFLLLHGIDVYKRQVLGPKTAELLKTFIELKK